jgi:hypothetical protein
VSGRVTIREATIEDAAAIHRALLTLAEHVGELHKVVSTADDIRRFGFEVEPPAFRTLIAEIDGAFAGMSLFFVTSRHGTGGPASMCRTSSSSPPFAVWMSVAN